MRRRRNPRIRLMRADMTTDATSNPGWSSVAEIRILWKQRVVFCCLGLRSRLREAPKLWPSVQCTHD